MLPRIYGSESEADHSLLRLTRADIFETEWLSTYPQDPLAIFSISTQVSPRNFSPTNGMIASVIR